jgi:hypothetical protein
VLTGFTWRKTSQGSREPQEEVSNHIALLLILADGGSRRFPPGLPPWIARITGKQNSLLEDLPEWKQVNTDDPEEAQRRLVKARHAVLPRLQIAAFADTIAALRIN